jgi:hypothetical protein
MPVLRLERGAHRPCGVVQSTRLPLMQETTGVKPVRTPIHGQAAGGERDSRLPGAQSRY